MGDAGALPDRKCERSREDGIGGLGSHRLKYGFARLFAQGPLAGDF